MIAGRRLDLMSYLYFLSCSRAKVDSRLVVYVQHMASWLNSSSVHSLGNMCTYAFVRDMSLTKNPLDGVWPFCSSSYSLAWHCFVNPDDLITDTVLSCSFISSKSKKIRHNLPTVTVHLYSKTCSVRVRSL